MRIGIILVGVTATAMVALDYTSQRDLRGGNLGLTDYAQDRYTDAKVALGLIPEPQPAPGMGAVIAALAARFGLGSTAERAPVDLADPEAVQAALASGNAAAVAAAAEAEFARVSTALAAAEAGASGAEARVAPAPRKPGQITIGSGSCGERAGAGKFCAVGKATSD
jgi:hypothetical protein